MLVNKNLLKPNEFASFLYDEFSFLNADDRDLHNDIVDSGEILIPLVITTDYIVISGVRRLKIINQLSNIKEVPVLMTEYHSKDLNQAIIIRYNIQRRKSIVEIAKEYDLITIGIVNVVDSMIARETNCGVYLNAGREVAVASTKSFTNQCIVFIQK